MGGSVDLLRCFGQHRGLLFVWSGSSRSKGMSGGLLGRELGWSPMDSDELVARAASSPAPWESEHPSVAIGNLRNQRVLLKSQMRAFERNFEYQHGWRPGPIDKREDAEYARLTRELKRCDAALRLARGVHNGPTVHDGGAGRKAALRDYAMSSMREPPRGQRAFPSGPHSSATLTAAALHQLAAVGDDGDDVISSSAGSPCMHPLGAGSPFLHPLGAGSPLFHPLGAASLIAGATRAGLSETSRWNCSTAEHGSSAASDACHGASDTSLPGRACHGACRGACHGASVGAAAAVTALPPSEALDGSPRRSMAHHGAPLPPSAALDSTATASKPVAPHCSPRCSAAMATTGRQWSAVVSSGATGRPWKGERRGEPWKSKRRHALGLLAGLRAPWRALFWGCASAPTAPRAPEDSWREEGKMTRPRVCV